MPHARPLSWVGGWPSIEATSLQFRFFTRLAAQTYQLSRMATVVAAEWLPILLRLCVATAAGAVLGWERSRQNRAIMGFRTLTLVALASCISVQAIVHSGLPQMNADAAGRVVQGVLSGVGFIGAGALLHGSGDQQVHGLATAAGIWVAAAMGAAAALAIWPLIIGGVALALFVLLIGAPIERQIRDHARTSGGEQDRQDMKDRP